MPQSLPQFSPAGSAKPAFVILSQDSRLRRGAIEPLRLFERRRLLLGSRRQILVARGNLPDGRARRFRRCLHCQHRIFEPMHESDRTTLRRARIHPWACRRASGQIERLRQLLERPGLPARTVAGQLCKDEDSGLTASPPSRRRSRAPRTRSTRTQGRHAAPLIALAAITLDGKRPDAPQRRSHRQAQP